ncbi:uncharacterized protein LOC101169423 isoform X12 [Oryzias latipes]
MAADINATYSREWMFIAAQRFSKIPVLPQHFQTVQRPPLPISTWHASDLWTVGKHRSQIWSVARGAVGNDVNRGDDSHILSYRGATLRAPPNAQKRAGSTL